MAMVDGPVGSWRAVASQWAALVDEGALDLPLPGSGGTRERWARLTALAERDLALARLAEGHVDALAILRELDIDLSTLPVRSTTPFGSGPGRARWGVWAAEPPGTGLTATAEADGMFRLDGLKAYCSGARSCTHALVTARNGEDRLLFAVDVGHAGITPRRGSWPASGMAGSDTLDIDFDQVPAAAVGGPRGYLDRPGFQHGGIGVAACWYGGARAVARTLHTAARSYDVGPHALAHLGAVCATLASVNALLDGAAEQIDADPLDLEGRAKLRSKTVRAATERACADVLDRVGRALGAGPLGHDADHARLVADLTVYVRQHHAERDYAALGQTVAAIDWNEVAC
jgi:alkylation response protein AidB-like acyl-CoA dehydrogenase